MATRDPKLSGSPTAIAALMVLLVAPSAVVGRLMAVDFGSENIRVSLVNSNRRPIQVEVVNNEISKRKTSAVVGFVNGERLLGEAAASVDGRYRNTVIARARDMLGKSADDTSLQAMLKANYLPYEISEDTKTRSVRLAMSEEESYIAEELVASILHYAHKISQQQFGGAFQDCVIVIPPFLGIRQRQALLDAAHIAGLNVISLIHSHSGAALQYGIERDFTNNTEMVIFYDMGASSVEVSLAKFSSVNKARKFQQFEILDVAWDENLGGSNLDLLLVEHFASEFQEKHGKDIREHPKVMSKLRKSAKKTKEILSANKAAPIYAEELHDGIDFSSSITRERFEELAAGFFSDAAKPLLKVLERNGLKPSDIANIELLGGGVRVPKLQDSLTAALGGQILSRHFTDPDEAVVLGSGLFAANFSSTFRMRPFGMVDCAPYALSLEVVTEGLASKDESKAGEDVEEKAVEAEKEEDEAEATAKKTIQLLPFRKKLPIKRTVKLGRLAGDTANMTLLYNSSEVLPPGVTDDALGTFVISGISESMKKYNKTGKVSVYFMVGPSGMVTVEKAESEVSIVEYYEVEVPVKEDKKNDAKPDEASSNPDEEADAEAMGEGDAAKEKAGGEENDPSAEEDGDSMEEGGDSKEAKEDGEAAGDKAEAEAEEGDQGKDDENSKDEKKKKVKKKSPTKEKPKMEKVKKQRKKTVRIPLKVTGGLHFGLSAEQLKASKSLLKAIADKDELKRATEAAKNDLESFIIDIGSIVYDEDVGKVSTEEAREKLTSEAARLEDWLYEDGESEVAATYRSKLEELKALTDPILLRAKELEARPAAVEAVVAKLAELTKVVEAWEEEKPWLNATDREGLVAKFEKLNKWMVERVKEQEAKQLTEDPAFTSDELLAKLAEAEKAFDKLEAKKPPKAPKVDKNGTDTNGADTNTTETIPEVPEEDGEQEPEDEEKAEDAERVGEEPEDGEHDEL